jgi:tryptophanase
MPGASPTGPCWRPLRGPALSSAERSRRLADAGYNVWRLEHADVELDLFTDVPHWSFVDAEVTGRRPDLPDAAEAVFGTAGAVATQCGRAAEHVLAGALARRRSPARLTVVSHGFFVTTERAFRLAGASIEAAPRARDGSSDPDLPWLEHRLRRGDVDVVCLEPSNGALAGWPLGPEAVEAAGDLARSGGAALVLDATRVLSNASALGLPVLDAAQRICRAADAFTVSCSKELLVAGGGLIGARDPALRRECFERSWSLGLHLEPARAQWELAHGLRAMREDPSPLERRRTHLRELAARLRRRGLPVIEPIAGHAVFVRLDERVEPEREHRSIALEGVLYERSGVRARISHHPLIRAHAVRLTWPLGAEVGVDELEAVAGAVESLLRDDSVPDLRVDPSSDGIALFRSYLRMTRESAR